MSRTKIIYVTSEFPPGPGGIGAHGYHLVSELHRRGYPITVYAPLRPKFAHEGVEFPFTVRYYDDESLGRLRKYSRLLKWLSADLAKNPSSLMIASGGISSWLVAWLKRWYRVPAIAVAHGLEVNPTSTWQRYIVKYALRSLDRVVAVSKYTAQRMDYLTPQQVVVINNGIDVARFEALLDMAPPISLKGSPALVTVGTLSERKGQMNVVNALPAIRRRFPRVHYHMVGIPQWGDRIRQRAQQLGVAEHITVHGALNDLQMATILKNADVFVMLSQETAAGDFEGFGIAILEANIAGLPAIGTRHSGISDAIREGYSGKLVDPQRPAEVVRALDEIMAQYSDYSKNARKWARQFDWKVMTDQYEHVIQQVVSFS